MRSFSPHNVKRTTRTRRITRDVVVIKERREGRPSSRERESNLARRAAQEGEEQTNAEGEGASFSFRKKISTGKREPSRISKRD